MADFAAKHRIDLAEQYDVLIGFIEDQQSQTPPADGDVVGKKFEEFIEFIDGEMSEPPPPPQPAIVPEPDAVPFEVAAPSVADTNAFFDRDLSRTCLETLVHLPSAGPLFTREGWDTATMPVPQAELVAVCNMLGEASSLDDGDIIDGWYHTFPGGFDAVVMLVAAPEIGGGCFLDAFLLLPRDYYPKAQYPSLPPRYNVDEDFTFLCPDGTYKVVRLVAAAD